MSIAIYRHMKLTVALPNEDPPIDTSDVARQFLGIKFRENEVDLSGQVKAIFTVLVTQFNKPDKRVTTDWIFDHGHVGLVHTTEVFDAERGWEKINYDVESVPPLCNLAWSTGRSDLELFHQFEKMSSRSVVELYYLYDVEAERIANFDIFQFDFNPNRPKHVPCMVKLPVRSFEEATKAAQMNTEETPDQWMRLLMRE